MNSAVFLRHLAMMECFMKFSLLLSTFSASFCNEDPVVRTAYGDVRGSSRITSESAPYDEFLGIPYALPPAGELRWQPPIPPEPWTGTRDAKVFGSKCTQQADEDSSEDCLYLNVYVPGSVNDLKLKEEKLPVLFYIHGGAFIYGSASNYDGGLLSTKGRVVLVTTNYRVSSMGFLSTQSSVAPGNYGLRDQIQALEWVRGNIEEFGGDPSLVTVMGQSAGAASVSHLTLSPLAKGLFKRVILVSGSAASYFAASSHQKLTTRRLARFYRCPIDSDQSTIDCLRDEPAFPLDRMGLLFPPLLDTYVCTQIPGIDGEVITQKPIDSMVSGYNAEYDLLTGITEDDGAYFCLPFTDSVEGVLFFMDFMLSAYQNKNELLDLVIQRFPEVLSENATTRAQTLTKIATDFVFGSRNLKEAQLHYQNSNRSTYIYKFRHQFERTDPSWLEGIHGEDLAFIFGRDNLTGDDLTLSNHIMSYYCNFVYTGNPNEGPYAVPISWPRFNPNINERLIESPTPYVETITEEQKEDLDFWNHFYDIMIPRIDNVYATEEREMLDFRKLDMWKTLLMEVQKSFKKSEE